MVSLTKKTKKEGKNDSSLLLKILQGGEARGRWRIDPCVWNWGKREKEIKLKFDKESQDLAELK